MCSNKFQKKNTVNKKTVKPIKYYYCNSILQGIKENSKDCSLRFTVLIILHITG